MGLLQEPADRQEKEKIRDEGDSQTLQGIPGSLMMEFVVNDRPEALLVQGIHEPGGNKNLWLQQAGCEGQRQAVLEDYDLFKERKSADISRRNGLPIGPPDKSHSSQHPRGCP